MKPIRGFFVSVAISSVFACSSGQVSPEVKALEAANHAAYGTYLDCLDEKFETLVNTKRTAEQVADEAQIECKSEYLAYINSREALIDSSNRSGLAGSSYNQATYGAEQKQKAAKSRLIEKVRVYRRAGGETEAPSETPSGEG